MAGSDGLQAALTVAALLRRLRLAAGLSQEELAVRANLSVYAIGAIERGVRRRPHPQTLRALASALALSTEDRALLLTVAAGEPPSSMGMVSPASDADELAGAQATLASLPADVLAQQAPLPPGSHMPLAPNPLFVGRSHELLRIAAVFKDGETTVPVDQTIACTGLGGLGKTQLAVEFVHRYGRFFAGGVFWLNFASAEEIPLQIAAFASPGTMGLPLGVQGLAQQQRLELVVSAWQSAVPRLLVFDNCGEEALLAAWRPRSGGCRVLVTSRRGHWAPTLGVSNMPLGVLPRRDSIELLRRYRPEPTAADASLDAVAHRLGDLPLALHLAGSYLATYSAEVSLAGYLTELDEPAALKHASLLGGGLDESPSPTDHTQSLAQTFALSVGRLDPSQDPDRLAIALLTRMAYMAPGEPVPRSLLARTTEEVETLRRADGLRRLDALGLLDDGEEWLRLHRLLAQFVRQKDLDSDAQLAVEQALCACGNDAIHGHLAGPALAAVIPHVVDVASRVSGDEMRMAAVCTAAGMVLQGAGDLNAATQWFERALGIRMRALGPDHLDTALSLHNLARLLQARSELATARALYERALEIRERVLGSDHPSTAQSLNNLGWLLRDCGDFAGARPFFERALAVRERVLGPDHFETAQSLHNLAWLLRVQGELAAARPLCERALAIWEGALGADHVVTSTCADSLARILHEQGELAAAKRLYKHALAIRLKLQGLSHPSTAQSLNHVARLMQAEGHLASARCLFEQSLAIWQRALGPDHPEVASTMHDLGALLRIQGEPDAARALHERALAIMEWKLGMEHPFTAASLHQLALVLRDQGEGEMARPMLERALAIRQRVLGPDHPDTARNRRDLVDLIQHNR